MINKQISLSIFHYDFYYRLGANADLFGVSNSKYPEIDKLLYYGKKDDKLKAYNLAQELNNKQPNDPEVLIRLAKACHCLYDVNRRDGNKAASEEYILKGIDYAKKAMEIAPDNPLTQKWFGVTTGANGQFQSLREKIKCGVVFRDQMNKAIKMSPNDFTLYSLKARYQYEIAKLSFWERKAAVLIVWDLDEPTFQDAITNALKSEQLAPGPWTENQLILAKCYIEAGEYKKGLEWLDKAKTIPVESYEVRN
ncbi:hypothetical protein WDU94_003826 [Cyamophila willieti]